MKRNLRQKQDLWRTTTDINDKLKIKETSQLFNHIEKLAAKHDVYVSSTMIKVTYKKALTNQNASKGVANISSSSSKNFNANSINSFEPNKKMKKDFKSMDLCNSDTSFISKSPKGQAEGSKSIACHSTPKKPGLGNEKEKKYINGVIPSAKPGGDKNSPVKVQKSFSSKQEVSSSSKKSKAVTKHNVSKRFLMDNVSFIKTRSSVVRKNAAKATKINKMDDNKNVNKLEKGVKKKTEVDGKGVKRKARGDIKVLAKKIKVTDNKMKKVVEGGGKFEVNYKLEDKKPIMFIDPDLPPGWKRYIKTKNKGSANEQYVVYIVNPQGKKFRFKWKLRKYLEMTKSSLDVDRFYFGLYHRPKSSANSLASNRDEKSNNDTGTISKGKSLGLTEGQKNPSAKHPKHDEGSNYEGKASEGKELLLFDPDLPFGWKRVIHSDNSSGKKQVHIISPDGKIFRRRYRLNEYLIKHKYTLNLNRFYFGLYPKKESNSSENSSKEGAQSGEKTSSPLKSNNGGGNNKLGRQGSDKEHVKGQKMEDILGNRELRVILRRVDEDRAFRHAFLNLNGGSKVNKVNSEIEKSVQCKDFVDAPMYDDPKLPKGWKRFIKIRSLGESAGRMEVVIISPDGRRHRSKKNLEHYLLQKDLGYKAEDFDFHVFGKSSPKKVPESAKEPEPDVPEPETEPEVPKPETEPEVPEPETEPDAEPQPNAMSFFSLKKKFIYKAVPDLDPDSLKDVEISPEGRMINEVNGLMVSCGLSSARDVRRERLPRKEVEMQVKSLLSSEDDSTCPNSKIPTYWIQRLVKCRGDLRTLDPNAVSIVGQATENFIRTMCFLAYSFSRESNGELRYEDVAELVHDLKSLAPLRTLIPKKITYKEFVKLNRPKQFLSYT